MPLTRDAPGLLLRDVLERESSVVRIANAIAEAEADIVVLTRFDFDASGITLRAFAELVGQGFEHGLQLRSNAGVPTGLDLDADGRLAEPEDAQAYGRFPGQEALALLSRFPILSDEAHGYNAELWRDMPDTLMMPTDPGWDIQRLSSGGHWTVPIHVPDGETTRTVTILAGHAGPPVFDGPEDRNGRRNRDELRLWTRILAVTDPPFVFMANTNLDPERGEGDRDAMAAFLRQDLLRDPLPGQVTAHWSRPGPMRVSYILPSAGVEVHAARVWPVIEDQQHSLITMDLVLPDAALP